MAQRRRSGKSLKRSAATRPEFRTVVVFCEGRNSEPDYVNGLKRLPHIAHDTTLKVEIHPKQGAPLTLVQMAVERSKDPEVDECWCLFDVEWPQNHPNLTAAVHLANTVGIGLAISNPCFEIWLIMHFKDCGRFVNTDTAERESRSLDGRPGKTIDPGIYLPRRQAAASRAEGLEKQHGRDGTVFPQDNPSSGMYRFIASLERNA